MKVTVKLIGPLVYEGGFSEKAVELPGPMTAGELSAFVKIDKKRPTIITRNGKAIANSETVNDGDRVVISHIYSGG
ncbi:MAG: MoaD/ThiS family protein [Elusimicrobiales bacterium]|nr:MoaD/ThiS family protein [Elusimicrobiales bacterium]